MSINIIKDVGKTYFFCLYILLTLISKFTSENILQVILRTSVTVIKYVKEVIRYGLVLGYEDLIL